MTEPPRSRRPVAFTISCWAGGLGALLLIAGALTSTEAVSVAGFVAGALSLAAALYWRSELVSAWAARRAAAAGDRPAPPGGEPRNRP